MFGEYLIEKGIIDNKQLVSALNSQKKKKKMLGETLVEMGLICEDDLEGLLKEHLLLRSDEIIENIK